MGDIEYTVQDGIATITLNRPHRRNAFTLAMVDRWAELLRQARDDSSVRVVLLTGAGGAFCAGVDLDDFTDVTSTLQRQQVLVNRVHRVAEAVRGLDKPLVAAIDGVAVGAGMDMALMCDIRLASHAARFSEGYVRVGLIPGDGGCYFLPRLIGTQKALELLWTGRFVEAEEALELDLVTALHPAEQLHDAALQLCGRFAAGPPVAIQAIKRVVRASQDSDVGTSLALVAAEQAVVQSTRDSQEALEAFREKRAPTFEGA